MINYEEQRKNMVKRQLKARDITDENVLKAMSEVPREKFVSKSLTNRAYDDSSLPIGSSQTISQPYMVALMIQVLQPKEDDIILDIGTVSGYAAAVASRIVKKVYSVEKIKSLAQKATDTINELGYDNIRIRHADGTDGWPEHAPYDGIMAAAATTDVPNALKDQLDTGASLVIPVDSERGFQRLKLYHKKEDGSFEISELHPVRFVPLVSSTD